MEKIFIPVNDDLYATLDIGSEAFPFEIFHDDLDNFYQGFVNWHKQKTIEISWVLEGSVKVCVLEEEHIISDNDAFVILPGMLHSIQSTGTDCGKYLTFIFDPVLLTGFSESYFTKQFYAPVLHARNACCKIENSADNQTIFSDIAWISAHFSPDNSESLLFTQQKLQKIWVELCARIFSSDKTPTEHPQDVRILQMLEYLRKNHDQKFSLSDMADAFHISRGECCRFFKKMMGMTISEYLLEYRLTKSMELLETTKLSITEIAHSVGFNSSSNYSALFRKKTGYTPKEYRT